MAIFSVRKTKAASDAENPYWMSFSDIMAGLLVIFILVCTTLLLKLSQMEEKVARNVEELQKASQVRSDILNEIVRELRAKGIQVFISDNDTILRIPESAFHFATSSYEIDPSLRPTAIKIGQALFEAISRDERWQYLETVFIEGHSDSRAAPNYRLGNWELSALRAISLWQFWIEETTYGPDMKKMRNRQGQLLFSVSGYAATRRVEEFENTEESMRKNRRIDIRFTTRQPSILEMKQVGAPLRGE